MAEKKLKHNFKKYHKKTNTGGSLYYIGSNSSTTDPQDEENV